MMEIAPLEYASADAVWARLADELRPLSTADLDIEDALGRYLAADVVASSDFPPFDRAVMDGYALRCADFHAAGAKLRVAGLVPAGGLPPVPLTAGECVRVNTGSVLPPGTDAVIPVEESREADGGLVEFAAVAAAEKHIERRGTIARRGDRILRAGTRISSGATAALIAAGINKVRCFAAPRVAILTTGDELVAAGATPGEGQLRNSNAIVLASLTAQFGGEPTSLGNCADSPAELAASLGRGLSHDVLVVTGGMSKGTHDLVPGSLEKLGVRWLATGLDLKPGKPTRIGRSISGGWVLALSGNPVSCVVCYLLFGEMILRGLRGGSTAPPPHLAGELLAEMPANGARPMYHPAEWLAGPRGQALLSPALWRGSGDPFVLAGANALVFRRRHAPVAQRGDEARFLPIDGLTA
ncbi:MAG: molybdopterin molybdotransferase MoeA [Planctomycetes bacterium]|nr:molybdopterin molybdotransferase MoeA [Planctomycetota bacterium]